MKNQWSIVAALVLMLSSFSPIYGGPLPGTPTGPDHWVVIVEENTLGSPNGFLNGRVSRNGGPFMQLPDSLAPGGVPQVELPFAREDGQLFLLDPGQLPPNDISDLLWWHPGGNFLCFYSTASPPETTGFMEINPPAPSGNQAPPMPDPEGPGAVIYVAGNATYIIFSDPVPEPASLTLLGIGIAGMAGFAWRRRKLAQT